MQDAHGAKNRADAMNACRLMDTLISTPDLSRTIFSDSIQLFSDDVLQEARATIGQLPAQEQTTNQQFLKDMFLELQKALEKTQQEMSTVLSQVRVTSIRTLTCTFKAGILTLFLEPQPECQGVSIVVVVAVAIVVIAITKTQPRYVGIAQRGHWTSRAFDEYL